MAATLSAPLSVFKLERIFRWRKYEPGTISVHRSKAGAIGCAAAQVNDSDHSPRIGPSLGMIRKAKGWTLKQFSDATGVSVATLSKIENDQAGLSFGTVLKIVSSLGMTFEELLSPGAGEGGRGRRAINRAGSGVRLATSQYDYEVFATELVAKRMVPLITRVKARTIADFPRLLGHAGEEWIYVLKGAIEIHTEYYAPVILRQGDSIYIDCGMGHASISIGEEDAELLSVVFGQETPPLPQGADPSSGRTKDAPAREPRRQNAAKTRRARASTSA
jgi:transcriptional regulator with XRE-family HTH domain